MYIQILMLMLSMTPQQNSDFQLDFNLTDKGYSYVNEPLPKGIQVVKEDGQGHILEVNTPTLIQVWSQCCGGDAEQWAHQRYTEFHFKDKGLRVVSINFENGKSQQQQKQMMQEFFKVNDKPSEWYIDPLGWAYDALRVKSFPTYILVSKEGTIIFKTAGKSTEGVALLDKEIKKLLGI
ncbi:MAG: hypothetical protein CR997_07915 [Acidobacteria bacterium]|nr:MAG: hypothetical protein CR997_07915 [Acidobacteriota bacterium]